jgi:predicted dinucleotide-binding enzyme
LATSWGEEGSATKSALDNAGSDLNGKILIDLTNPLKFAGGKL